jgi:uncharacterized protein (DUF952 family)
VLEACQDHAVRIFKILLPAEWAQFEADGYFDGSPFDRTSGYIHLSTREQVVGTAERRFADAGPLVVVAIDPDAFVELIRWEMMPNGGPYPHLYGRLPITAVLAVYHVTEAATVEAALTRSDPPV